MTKKWLWYVCIGLICCSSIAYVYAKQTSGATRIKGNLTAVETKIAPIAKTIENAKTEAVTPSENPVATRTSSGVASELERGTQAKMLRERLENGEQLNEIEMAMIAEFWPEYVQELIQYPRPQRDPSHQPAPSLDRTCAECEPDDQDLGLIGNTVWGYFATGNLGNGGKWVGQFTGVAGTAYHWDLCSTAPGTGTNSGFDPDIRIRDAACTQIAYVDGLSSCTETWSPNDFVWTCTVAGTYYVEIMPYSSGCLGTVNNTFSLNYYAVGVQINPGDNCGNALALTVPGTVTGTTVGFINDYDSGVFGTGCPYSGSTAPDVVYSYTPVADEVVTFDMCNSGYDSKLYVATGCPPTTIIACNDDGCSDPLGNPYRSLLECVALTGGVTYYVIVDGYGSNSGTYNLTAGACTPCLPIPPNDNCEDAPIQTLPYTWSGSNLCATNDCASFPGGNVWIAFEVPAGCNEFSLNYCGSLNTASGPFGNVWLNLALGCPCTGFTAAGTWVADCPDGNITVTWTGLAAGTYYYPVLLDAANGADGDYNITVQCAAPCEPIPANNDCANATVETLPHTWTGSNLCATSDCSLLGTPEVWLALEVPAGCSELVLDYCGSLTTANAPFNNVFIVLVDACPCGSTLLATDWYNTCCADGNWTVSWTGLAAGTYYYPVLMEAGSDGNYNITARCMPTAPNLCETGDVISNLTVIRGGNPANAYVTLNWTNANAGDYNVWSSINPANDGNPDGSDPDLKAGDDPQWALETLTPLSLPVGPVSWNRPDGFESYVNFVVTPDCDPTPYMGRCCYVDGGLSACANNTQAECALLGGDWLYGYNCEECPPCPPLGRCCYLDGNNQGACANLTAAACQALPGWWTWTEGLTCEANPCDIGRCCYNGGASCADVQEVECNFLGGLWDTNLDCATACPVILNGGETCADAVALTIGQTVNGTTTGALDDDPASNDVSLPIYCALGSSDPYQGNTAPDVWYSFVGAGDSVSVSMCNATAFDQQLLVVCGDCATPTCVAGNDDSGCSLWGTASVVSFAAENGRTYLICVDGWYTNAGNYVLSIIPGNPASTYVACP